VKISVITAVYNSRETIADAIVSVIDQSFPNIEFIVIDGFSTDGTSEIIEQFRDQIDVLVSEPDEGIYDALNKGIMYANGDVVGFLHADDIFASTDVLSRIAESFADVSIDAVFGDLVYVDKSDPNKVIRYWQSGDFDISKLKLGWMPPHPTFYVRRSVYEKLGGFDTSFHISADYDCMLRLLIQTDLKVRYINEIFVRMRVGGKSNRSLKNILIKMIEDTRVIKKNGVGGLGTLIGKNLCKIPQFIKSH